MRVNKVPFYLFCLGIVLFWAGLYLFVPILSVYSRDKGASLALIGLITGSYGMTQLIFRIPLGVTSDRLGVRKPFVLAGFLIVVASCLGLAWAPSPPWIFWFRALSGVAASVWVTVTVFFAGFFPHDQAVRATGLLSFLSGVGQMAATTAGGWVADEWGWLAPFFGGAILAGVGLLFSLPIQERPTPRENRLTLQRFLRVATVPTLLLISLVAAFDQYAFHTTLQGFIPLYATELGASKTTLGWLASSTLIPYLLMSLVASRVAWRIGERLAVGLGLLVTFIAVATVPWVHGVPLLIATRVLHGLGRGFVYPVAMGMSIKAVAQEERATAMGIFQAVYALGMFAGPALSGVVAQFWGLDAVFWSTAGFSLISILLVILPIWPQEETADAS
jgi:MFS family permease